MTELNYLKDTYLFEDTATVLDIVRNEQGTAVILDKTIFYPQGGGQPTDTGTIGLEKATFRVEQVRLDENGVVFHYGQFESGALEKGETVSLKVDQEKRKLHARLHSAGHLVDCAVTKLALDLLPGKGFHFVEGPYVEYAGVLEDPVATQAKLQSVLDELIKEDMPLRISEVSEEEAAAKGIQAPLGKSVRTVGFEGFAPCGCGGTHVIASGEIGTLTIRKIKAKKGNTRIAYSVD